MVNILIFQEMRVVVNFQQGFEIQKVKPPVCRAWHIINSSKLILTILNMKLVLIFIYLHIDL